MSENSIPEVCDYGQTSASYRTDFWEGKGRDYEDQVERIAIRRLLTTKGKRLLEVGAGFGRLTGEYTLYEQVVVMDYSLPQLEEAREHYGDKGFIYVAANVYQLPFGDDVFDGATMIRVLHHMEQPESALKQIYAVMVDKGTFLLEFANKQNIKAIARWIFRKQDWSPFSKDPIEFVRLNFDFHPRYIKDLLENNGFISNRMLTVSHYRIAILKNIIPTPILVFMDSMAQLTGNLWQLAPSVFVRNTVTKNSLASSNDRFWKCPTCKSVDLMSHDSYLECQNCGIHWGIKNGVYDFVNPIKNKTE